MSRVATTPAKTYDKDAQITLVQQITNFSGMWSVPIQSHVILEGTAGDICSHLRIQPKNFSLRSIISTYKRERAVPSWKEAEHNRENGYQAGPAYGIKSFNKKDFKGMVPDEVKTSKNVKMTIYRGRNPF